MSPAETQEIRITDRLAPIMFALSLVFLVLIAALIVCWVDIPRVEWLAAEAAEGQEEVLELRPATLVEQNALSMGNVFFFILLAMWPLFGAELIYHIREQGSIKQFWKQRKFDFAACFCPPLRLAAPSHCKGGQIWLPKLGWQQPGKLLKRKLERVFGSPMLLIALLILPILLIEFGLQDLVESSFPLRLTLHICTGLIWCAFAIEFIVMISATDRKFAYVKKNWIDLAIILLPLISFLRSLRVIRAFKVAKFAKVQQLARVGRIYRMRGLMAKALRALMLFEFLHRLLRVTPEKKLAKLLAEREERAEELMEMDEEIQRMRLMIQEKALEQKRLEAAELQAASEVSNEEPNKDPANIAPGKQT